MHAEILNDIQRDVLGMLAPVAHRERFHLAGGTALALHLGHRRSEDFDWFGSVFPEDALTLADRVRHDVPTFVTTAFDTGTLHGELLGVRISFLAYRYPSLKEPIYHPELGCAVASLDDIACMKLSAIAQRGAKRDFVDVYALLRSVASLDEMIEAYKRKFSISDAGSVLMGLSYFDDAENEPMPVTRTAVTWEEMKAVIRTQLSDYLRNLH